MTEDEAQKIQPPYREGRIGRANDPKRCCACNRSSGFYRRQCDNPIKVRYGRLGYCGIHDPAKVKARREATDARWRAESKAREKLALNAKHRRDFLAECECAVRAIAAGNNDPRGLCAGIIQRHEDGREDQS